MTRSRPSFLCVVKRAVCALQGGCDIFLHRGIQSRDPQTRGDRDFLSFDDVGLLSYGFPDAARNDLCLHVIGVGMHDHELFTSQPPHKVIGAGRRLDAAVKLLEPTGRYLGHNRARTLSRDREKAVPLHGR
jgi:hypothetical protein